MGAVAKRNLANALIAGFLLVVMAYLGVPEMLGAHPAWSVKIAYIGVGFGIVLYSIAWIWETGWLAKFLGFLLLLAVFSGVTWFGKMRFVESIAEDALSGRLWYFGWIAVAGAVFALLMHLLKVRSLD